MTETEEITLCAVRYALGRSSYVISDVIDFVMNLEKPYSTGFLNVCIRDIRQELKEYPEISYKKEWEKLVEYLNKFEEVL